MRFRVRQLTAVPLGGAIVLFGFDYHAWALLAVMSAYVALYAILIDREHAEVVDNAAR